MPLVSLQELKDYGGLDSLTVEEEGVLRRAEATAVEYFGLKTDRYWGDPVSHTYYLSGDGSVDLVVPDPIRTLTAVSERDPGGGGTLVAVDPTFYELVDDGPQHPNLSTILRRIDGGWWLAGARNYTVQATVGVSAVDEETPTRSDAPELVQLAVSALAHMIYQGRPLLNATNETGTPGGLPLLVEDAIVTYRRPIYRDLRRPAFR